MYNIESVTHHVVCVLKHRHRACGLGWIESMMMGILFEVKRIGDRSNLELGNRWSGKVLPAQQLYICHAITAIELWSLRPEEPASDGEGQSLHSGLLIYKLTE